MIQIYLIYFIFILIRGFVDVQDICVFNLYRLERIIDLKEYRESVRQILREMKFEDVAMEYFTAEDKRPVDKYLSEVASCDLYIGIFFGDMGTSHLERPNL